MDRYDALLLAAWDKIKDRVRLHGFPRIRWQALVNGEWVNEPTYGRPNMWLQDAVEEMIEEGILDLSDQDTAKAVKRIMVNSAYPRMARLQVLLIREKIHVPF